LGALKVTVVDQFGEAAVALVVRQMPPSVVATQTWSALKGLTATAWMAPTFCWSCEVFPKLIPGAGLPVELGPCSTQVGVPIVGWPSKAPSDGVAGRGKNR
jgi:hypothetical protein